MQESYGFFEKSCESRGGISKNEKKFRANQMLQKKVLVIPLQVNSCYVFIFGCIVVITMYQVGAYFAHTDNNKGTN